jgi:predicted nucleic acid-binding protein
LVHDAHVVALALEHGFGEILTEDRDFHRFPGVRVVGLS